MFRQEPPEMQKKETGLEFQVLASCPVLSAQAQNCYSPSSVWIYDGTLHSGHGKTTLYYCFNALLLAEEPKAALCKNHISPWRSMILTFSAWFGGAFSTSYSKSDLVSFSISLIILTLAGACVMPEKQSEEEELDSEIWMWYTMKNSAVQLPFIFSPRIRLPPRKLRNNFLNIWIKSDPNRYLLPPNLAK